MMKIFCRESSQEIIKADTKRGCILTSNKVRNAEGTKTKLVIEKKLHFFLQAGKEECFLFTQSFSQELFDTFKNGVILEKALDSSLAKRNKSILKVIYKIPSHIRYIEESYGIKILRKPSMKKAKPIGAEMALTQKEAEPFSE